MSRAMSNYDMVTVCASYDKLMETDKWHDAMPYLRFKSDWLVKISTPKMGAVIRYCIKRGKAFISVYLDCYDNLGLMGSPYYEVYDGEECYRFLINKSDEMMEFINDTIERLDPIERIEVD